MKMQWLAVAALAASPAITLAADGTFDKTLHVSSSVQLSVSTGSGYIRVSPGSDSEIHIIGHVHAGHNGWGNDSESPEERVKQVVSNPPIEQAGDIVTIGRHTNYRNVSIDYDITTPKGTNLEANSGSGDLHLMNIGGSLKANTGSGTIEASGITGRVVLGTGSGDIRAEMHSAPDVKAETGSGSIKLDGVTGGLYAETGSGDIEIGGQPGTNWKLETGSGSVTLNTGGRAKFSLDATTGSGSVHSDPPITTHGSLEKHHVTGDINGGGPTVRVETGSGDVRIR
jgi:Putative adhesin